MAALPLLALLSLAATPAVESIRSEAAAHVRIQSVLDWYTRTQGEPSIRDLTYRGRDDLFSPSSIAAVSRALRRRGVGAEEQRALSFLRSYLAVEHLSQTTARYDDEAQNAELKATITLPWRPEPVPYKEIENLLKEEADAGRRAEIESARSAVWRDTLNPILERKEREAQRLARKLGFKSYVAMSEEARLTQIQPLLAEGARFFQATDAQYRALLSELAQRELNIPVEQLRRSDLVRLRTGPRFLKYFPKELMKPAFLYFLSGIGLELKSVEGTPIRLDDAPHPLKEPRAACYPIDVPNDVRITVKPTDGMEDIATFFHEGGHALHFANATTKVWEFQYLGSNAMTEAYAEFFGKVFAEPTWLKRYRAFVVDYNAKHKTSFPTFTDAEIGELSKIRLLSDFYFLRRYGFAKLVYESALHGGDPSIWKAVYPKPTSDLKAVYADVFGAAYGFPLREEDALRFRTDVDDTFYAADYARAFGMGDLMHEVIRQRYGVDGDWYENKEVGALLRSLFADGQRLQPDEVAVKLGYPKLTFEASEARVRRLLGP